MSDSEVDLNSRPSKPPSEELSSTKQRRFKAWMVFVLLAGVLLPIATIAFELAFRPCSSIFFDPLPTVWHVILLGIVPVANFAVFLSCLRQSVSFARTITFLVGAAIGVSVVYSALVLPFIHFSILLILFLGMGLAGLSPYLALGSLMVCKTHLSDLQLIDRRLHRRLLWAGILTTTVLLGAFIFTGLATDIGLKMAASPDEKKSARGVKLIRTFGNQTELLRACYELPSTAWPGIPDLRMTTDPNRREGARNAYYRVTGSLFNSVAPPKLFGPRSEWTEDFRFDSDVGGSAVNGIAADLGMSSSRMDGVVDPDSLVTYLEWTLVFSNKAQVAREARAEIALPPGGVVSRLTLWVNGDQREAAFSTRGKVRQAYQEVAVRQSRDPVLVTTCGPDRAFVQCFPVPAGGTMKIRMGITAPLAPDGYSKGSFLLPRIIERNFAIPRSVQRSLFIRSTRQIALGSNPSNAGKFIGATVSEDEIAGAAGSVTCSRDPNVRSSWTWAPYDPSQAASAISSTIVQTLRESSPQPPANLVVVIDAGQKMQNALPDISKALADLPEKTKVSLIVAGDEITGPISAPVRDIQDRISQIDCAGGVDNRPALLKAFDATANRPGSVVLWLHGAQPLKSDAHAEQLLQRVENRGAVQVYAVAVADGRNTIFADLEQTGIISVVPRRGSVSQDLSRLFSEWKQPHIIAVREHVEPRGMTGAPSGSSHLRALWARDQVMGICRMADSRRISEASELAAKNQIVTPVSGAVVLETQEQYDRTGLKPVDPTSVPSLVPEPTGLLALATGAIALLAARRRRKKNTTR